MAVTMQTIWRHARRPVPDAGDGYTRRSQLSSDNGREVIGKCYQPRGGDQGPSERVWWVLIAIARAKKFWEFPFLRDSLAPREDSEILL
jgi:hypothetical protein